MQKIKKIWDGYLKLLNYWFLDVRCHLHICTLLCDERERPGIELLPQCVGPSHSGFLMKSYAYFREFTTSELIAELTSIPSGVKYSLPAMHCWWAHNEGETAVQCCFENLLLGSERYIRGYHHKRCIKNPNLSHFGPSNIHSRLFKNIMNWSVY